MNKKTTPLTIQLGETDSTSNYLSKISNDWKPAEFTVVSAHYQTAGKGQRGNSWESEKGENLLFSMILYPTFLQVRNQFLLSKAIALSIKEVLDQSAEGFLIKWPNDIYWKEQKICGILIENELTGSTLEKCIIGVGININQKEFQQAPNPVSLWQITGKEHQIQKILDAVIEKFHYYYDLLKQGEHQQINQLYHRSLYRKEGFHRYKDSQGEFSARIVEVEENGLLVLEDAQGGIRKKAFKEVSFLS
ncbi:biotin--[acetyl-CoA-carboxylase] ligase [Bacteroides sp. OttesenSCG-928-M17]|nr:biotin--[acetyl-CoA-carboxylase] ligase [Bacteroides sp. OttesenSCG-928-M17]